jgi:hypothetical protein
MPIHGAQPAPRDPPPSCPFLLGAPQERVERSLEGDDVSVLIEHPASRDRVVARDRLEENLAEEQLRVDGRAPTLLGLELARLLDRLNTAMQDEGLEHGPQRLSRLEHRLGVADLRPDGIAEGRKEFERLLLLIDARRLGFQRARSRACSWLSSLAAASRAGSSSALKSRHSTSVWPPSV